MAGHGPVPVGPVLVTGANGFIGRALSEHLAGLGVEVRRVDVAGEPIAGIRLGSTTDPRPWAPLLDGVETGIERAREVLGFAPAIDLDAGTAEVERWAAAQGLLGPRRRTATATAEGG